MAVDFAADMQQELDYFAAAPPAGMGVDGIFSDCPRTTREWINSQCASRLLARQPTLLESSPPDSDFDSTSSAED